MAQACKILLGDVLEWPEHGSLQQRNLTLMISLDLCNLEFCQCFPTSKTGKESSSYQSDENV